MSLSVHHFANVAMMIIAVLSCKSLIGLSLGLVPLTHQAFLFGADQATSTKKLCVDQQIWTIPLVFKTCGLQVRMRFADSIERSRSL